MSIPAPRSPRPVTRGLGSRGRRRLPSTSGPQLTDRDLEVLRWIGRHGVVTPSQVARHFFTRDGGSVGQWAAYRRLRKLEQLGLVRHDRTFWRETSVLRLTGAGAHLADIDLGPARLVLAELRHTLAVVDLVESLLAASPIGTEIRTERELRVERWRQLRDGTRKVGWGRIPDALFIHPLGAKVAIELDVTPKRTREIERIVKAYLQDRYDRIVWYVLPRQEERLKAVVRQHLADDYIETRTWYRSPRLGGL